jgi:hypothetical protein
MPRAWPVSIELIDLPFSHLSHVAVKQCSPGFSLGMFRYKEIGYFVTIFFEHSSQVTSLWRSTRRCSLAAHKMDASPQGLSGGLCVAMTWEAKAQARYGLESCLSESRDSDGVGVKSCGRRLRTDQVEPFLRPGYQGGTHVDAFQDQPIRRDSELQ